MKGPLLRVFFALLASGGKGGGGGKQGPGDLCYLQLERPEAQMMTYYCPGLQDHADARFCCGTCQEPFCCASQENSLDPTQCPDFDPVTTVTSPTTSPQGKDSQLNIVWCLIGIFVGTIVLWCLCRNIAVLKCPRVCACIFEDEEEEEEEEEEIEMEDVRGPVPPPQPLPPSPSFLRPLHYLETPPPYSEIDPIASSPPSVTNAPLGMDPPEEESTARLRGAEEEIPARLRGAEGGSPTRMRGAEEGARPRIRGAEGGIPARSRGAEREDPAMFHDAERGALAPPYSGDPPPYSDIDLYASPTLQSRRKRRGKASRAVLRAPSKRTGVVWECPPEYAEAVGGAPPEYAEAVGGAPPEPAGAVGGDPPEPAGAVGGAPPEPAGAVGGAPPEPAGAVGGAPPEASGAEGGVPAEPSGAI